MGESYLWPMNGNESFWHGQPIQSEIENDENENLTVLQKVIDYLKSFFEDEKIDRILYHYNIEKKVQQDNETEAFSVVEEKFV